MSKFDKSGEIPDCCIKLGMLESPRSINANDMKYMFAMLCSKPKATNADIGNTIARILLVTLRPPVARKIARHTNMLQRIARKNALEKSRFTL